MLHDTLDAFVSRNVEHAHFVIAQNDALDALKDQIFRELALEIASIQKLPTWCAESLSYRRAFSVRRPAANHVRLATSD